MAKFCLLKEDAAKFKKAITDGSIKPAELADMSSEKRHEFFAKLLGEENAKGTNALFESKLLLKNKKTGWINWAKSLTGISEPAKRDIQSKIARMVKDLKTGKTILNPDTEEAFLKDLASTKLGTDVSFEEAKKITELSTKLTESKKEMNPTDFSFKSEDTRLQHGYDIVNLKNYVADLKDKVKVVTFGQRINPLSREFIVYQTPGFSKTVKAAFDASALLRQGLKTLLTHPSDWARNTIETFKDIGKQVKNGSKSNAVMDAIKADLYSRPNALNGNYDRMKLAIGLMEEQYPTDLPSKVPILGRLYKASEVAYTGFLYRVRGDLADRFIESATKQGIDMGEKLQVESIGKLINSMTGRGSLGPAEPVGKYINAALFSPKFMMSNFETLTAHYLSFSPKMSGFARKEAGKNLLKIIGGIGATLAITDKMIPGSVEWDPRSANFGKIKIGDTRFDITGGMSSIPTLFARILTQSSKSGQTGTVSKLGGGFGQTKGMDIVYQFMENKYSPTLSLFKDLINQTDYQGNKLTLGGEMQNLLMPLPITNAQEILKNPNSAPLIVAMIADSLGIATNTYSISGNKDWSSNTGAELTQMREKLGPDKFKKANDDYNTLVNEKILKVASDPRYKALSDEGKQSALAKVKDLIKQKIFVKYNFVYQQKPDKVKPKESPIISSLVK